MGDEEKDLEGIGPSEEDLEAELEAELDKLSLDDEINEEDLLGEEELVIDGSVDLEGLGDDEPEEILEVEEPPTFEAETVTEDVPEELELEDALPQEEPVEPLGGADLGDDAESEEISLDDLASGLEEELEVIEQEETRGAEPELEAPDSDLDELMSEADLSPEVEKDEPLEIEPEAEALELEVEEEEPLELDTESLELDTEEIETDLGPAEEPAAAEAGEDELLSELEVMDIPDGEEEPVGAAEETDEEEIIFPTDEQMGIVGGPEEGKAETSEAAAVTEGAEVDETDMSFLEELEGETGQVAEEEIEEGEDEEVHEPVFEVEDEDEVEHEDEGKRSSPLVLIAGAIVLIAGIGYLWWSGMYRDLPVVGPLLGGGEPVEEFLVEEMPMPSAETPTPGEQALPEVSVVPVEPEAAGPVLEVDGPLFPYAVHTSSFKRLWLANREVVRLNRAGFSAFRAYTNVPGRGWFHRVYVPEAGSPSAGLNLANRMKAGGVSAFAETRNVPFGCLLGVYNDRAAAEARITELRESGYSPYIEAEAGDKLRLYVGAFGSSDECGDLAAKLDSDDIPHRIVER
jgi:cell division septation protein DedD